MKSWVAAVFSGYEVVEELSSGPWGELYKANVLEYGYPVLLRVLPSGCSTDTAFRARLTGEAKGASAVRFHGVARFHALGERLGRFWAAVEFVEGVSLRTHLETTGSVGLRAALNTVWHVANSLMKAHAKNVAHQGVGPHTIIMTRDGLTKLTNLGLAWIDSESAAARDGDPEPYAQRYLSPEQWLGNGSTPRADIYSLGLVLFEMLGGKTIFHGLSAGEMRQRALSGKILDIAATYADIPEPVQRMLGKMLHVQPASRYLSVHSILGDLEILYRSGNVPRSGP